MPLSQESKIVLARERDRLQSIKKNVEKEYNSTMRQVKNLQKKMNNLDGDIGKIDGDISGN